VWKKRGEHGGSKKAVVFLGMRMGGKSNTAKKQQKKEKEQHCRMRNRECPKEIRPLP